MSAVVEWLPLWLRVALAVVVFVMGSIVLLAAYQAAKVIGAVALEACFNAATHLVDRLTAVFVGWAFSLARRIGLLVRGVLGVLLGAVRAAPQVDRQPQQRVPPRSDQFQRATNRAAGGPQQPPPGGRARAAQGHAKASPSPPPPPPPKPPPDPKVLAYQAACRLFGLPVGGFTPEQLNKVFRTRIHAAHPDRGGNHEQAAALAAARDLIRNWHGWVR